MISDDSAASPPQFQPQQISSLRDMVYDVLREAILDGSLAAGQRIKERDVAAQMQISTTPVKEALRRLEQDGLIISQPRRGVVVSDTALISVEEIVEIRAYLEGLATRLAATKITAAELAALGEQANRMALLTDTKDAEALFVANTEFHRLIRQASRNHFITKFVEILGPFDRSIRRQALSYPEEAERGLQEHMAVYAALKQRDGIAAEQAMRQHVLRTVKFVIGQAEINQALDEAG